MNQDQQRKVGRPEADAVVGQGFRPAAGARPDANPAAGAEGVGTLIAGAVQDLEDVVRAEIKLARTELKEDAVAAGRGIAYIAAGAIVGLVGFIILMLAVAYLLDTWLPLWIAAGIVGIALLIIAAIVALAGKSKLSASNLKPEQTIESLKEDKAWASRQINSVTK